MTILPKELTVIEIAHQLHVTTKWVEMTLDLLRFEGRQGRGNKRIFNPEEFRIFENVKLLRLCMFSWRELVEIRKREHAAKEKIRSYILGFLKARLSASTSVPAHPWALNFILVEAFDPFTDFKGVGDLRALTGPAKMGVLKKIDRMLHDCKVAEIKDDVQRKIQDRVTAMQRQQDVLKQYAASAARFYRSHAPGAIDIFSAAGSE